MRAYGSLIISILVLFVFASPAGANSPQDYPAFSKFGPNCWNFVLKYLGALEGYRSVSLGEFLDFMNSPQCAPVTTPEKGDIGSVILPEHGLAHSFIFLDSRTGISKGSPYPSEQVELEDLEVTFSIPEVRIEYRRCNFPKGFRHQEDSKFASLRKIEERLDGYLTDKFDLSNEELSSMRKELLSVDSKFLDDSKFSHRFYSVLSNLAVLAPSEGLDSKGAKRLQDLVQWAESAEEVANKPYKQKP